MSVCQFLGFSIYSKSFRSLVNDIKMMAVSGKFCRIVTLNTQMLIAAKNKRSMRDWLRSASVVTADGKGVVFASKWVFGRSLKSLTGVDLVRYLFKHTTLSFYCVGASELSIKKAAKAIVSEFPHSNILGCHHGYLTAEKQQRVIRSIMEKKPDVILVGMGFPKQEQFIKALSKQLSSGVAIGIGGVFDVYSGEAKRAPKWVTSFYLEWLFRGLSSPKRMLSWGYMISYCTWMLSLKMKRLLGQKISNSLK